MIKNKRSFAVHASLCSMVIPICTYCVNHAIDHLHTDIRWLGAFTQIVLLIIIYGIGLLSAIVALFGIKAHGSKAIKGFATTGLILNALLLTGTVVLMPALIRVKEYSQYKSFIEILKEDTIQMQTTGTVPVRTFSNKEYGSIAPLLQFVNDNMVHKMNLSIEFQKQVAHVNIANCLEASHLIEPNSIADSRQQILILQRSYQEFITKVGEQIKTTCRKINDLNVSRAMKAGFIEGYMDRQIKEGKILQEMKQTHLSYTNAIIELLSFMEKKLTVCSLEGDYLIFEQNTDREQFDILWAQITALENKLNDIITRTQDRVQKSVESVQYTL